MVHVAVIVVYVPTMFVRVRPNSPPQRPIGSRCRTVSDTKSFMMTFYEETYMGLGMRCQKRLTLTSWTIPVLLRYIMRMYRLCQFYWLIATSMLTCANQVDVLHFFGHSISPNWVLRPKRPKRTHGSISSSNATTSIRILSTENICRRYYMLSEADGLM